MVVSLELLEKATLAFEDGDECVREGARKYVLKALKTDLLDLYLFNYII